MRFEIALPRAQCLGRGLIGSRDEQRVEFVVMLGAPFLRRRHLQHQRRPGRFHRRHRDVVAGAEIADRVDPGLAGNEHIGTLDQRPERPQLAGRTSGVIGGHDEGRDLGRGEIRLPRRECGDRAGLAGRHPFDRDRAEAHLLGHPLDHVLVLHNDERQRAEIERPHDAERRALAGGGLHGHDQAEP